MCFAVYCTCLQIFLIYVFFVFSIVAAGLPFQYSGCRWVLPLHLRMPLGCRLHSQVAAGLLFSHSAYRWVASSHSGCRWVAASHSGCRLLPSCRWVCRFLARLPAGCRFHSRVATGLPHSRVADLVALGLPTWVCRFHSRLRTHIHHQKMSYTFFRCSTLYIGFETEFGLSFEN